jgi:hypothetical protein
MMSRQSFLPPAFTPGLALYQGNLIRARLSEKGYEEMSRVHLIDPTYSFFGRKVTWAPPAYANCHIFVRNDDELICASLEATER